MLTNTIHMKKIILILVTIVLYANSFADGIKLNDAQYAAKTYYYQNVQSFRAQGWDEINLQLVNNPEEGVYPMYIFNVNENEGFIIVSALNTMKPVLAYSFEGAFNPGNMSPGQTAFIQYFADETMLALSGDIVVKEGVSAEWDRLLRYTPGTSFEKDVTVGPLVNAKWNQNWPYNASCPVDDDCPDYSSDNHDHVYVGCVAIGMLQVMKYYNWPPSGEGSKTHLSWTNGGYGNITINFAQQTYNWYAMPNSLGGTENSEVAKICYHAGVAVSMWWGCDGSGSQTDKIVTALENYFKYSSDAQFIEKSDYTDSNWKTVLRNQLNQNKPMVYGGTSTTVGHAWTCDGYQNTDYFHMNWGWGGAGDGFYALDNLVSTATPGGPENDFSTGQEAVINIYPESGYPLYCGQNINLNTPSGAFGDGSSNLDYQNNQQCSYLIQPTCGAVVQLNFDSFDLAEGDIVRVFNGSNADAEVIETYTSENTPGTDNIYADRGAMYIQFITDGSGVASGWDASYVVKNCKTNIVYYEPSGSFDDGSGVCDYGSSSSTVCTWFIQPEDAAWINIHFTDFHLAGSPDYVKVFKNSTGSENLVAQFSSTALPTTDIMVEAGVAVVQFFANTTGNDEGWALEYTSSTTAVENLSLKPVVQVFPNPSEGNATINFYSQGSHEATFVISDITGKLIANKRIASSDCIFHTSVQDLVGNSLPDGLYILEIYSGSNSVTEKVMITR